MTMIMIMLKKWKNNHKKSHHQNNQNKFENPYKTFEKVLKMKFKPIIHLKIKMKSSMKTIKSTHTCSNLNFMKKEIILVFTKETLSIKKINIIF